MTDLASSDVTDQEWSAAFRNLCNPSPPELCDCGYLGAWERRTVYVWGNHPGYRRGDKAIRRDIARGLPARPNDEGWWCMAGWDERCPECGDIERFDEDGNVVARFAEQAKVVVFMDARRG